jgi:hypothetical protein
MAATSRAANRLTRLTHRAAWLTAPVLLAAFAPGATAASSWTLERSWEVEGAVGAAVAPGGDVWVPYDRGFGTVGVQQYTGGGKLVRQWGVPWSPQEGFALDDARVLIARDEGGIVAFDQDGRELESMPVFDAEPPEGDPRYPTVPSSLSWIDVDARRERYVVNQKYGGVEIQRLSASGQRIAHLSVSGSSPSPGQFEAVPEVASDGRGNVYASDAADRVQRFTDGFQLVGQWGQRGTQPGQLMDPAAIATDASGDVWVADNGGSPARVQQFRPSGELVEEIVLPDDLSKNPVAVDFDAAGRLFVVTGGKQMDGWVRVYRRAAASIASRSLRYRRGRVEVKVRCPGPDGCRGTVRLTAKGRSVGSRRYRAAAGRTVAVSVRPGRRARRVVSRARRVTVTVRPSRGAATRKTLRLRH